MEIYNELLASSPELSIIEIFKLSWKIFKKNIGPIIAISFVMSLPYSISHGTVKDYHSFNSLNVFLFVVGFISQIIGSCALIQFIADIIYNKAINWTTIMSFARAKSSTAAITYAIFMLRILLLGLLFVIPGIIYTILYIFTLEAVVLRDLRGMKALKYSKELVKGYWWRVFSSLLLTKGIEILFAYIFKTYFTSLSFYFLLGPVFKGFEVVFTLMLFLRLEQLKELTPVAIETKSFTKDSPLSREE
ncbi:hypothetical protein [Pelosinus sp. IPA-1]|uniref:hypothetical protein n=1 Tax=Pelosinus sp. IPA-1 TaxID=3029569 RepID=UPI002436299E|nr:hypothetical protein [Pelosinus sp. IPA-1]GMA98092.1 hypothetical protein PIPA1_08920 [Pelosinus sp. IPA-1]